MKILLVAPSYYPQVNAAYFPLGLAYVASYTKAKGHTVDGLNLNHYPDPERYNLLQETLSGSDYDVVGITGLSVCFNEIEKLIKQIRVADPSVTVVLGGGITSCEAALVMQTLRPDFMVIGEGELIFVNLLDAIAIGERVSFVKGIWYWGEDGPLCTGIGPAEKDLNVLPEPDLELMGIEKNIALQKDSRISYHLVRYDIGRSIHVLASRSCPFKCTFCHHAGMGEYKTHDIDRVVAQIEQYVKKYDVSRISILDELFSANKERLRSFCNRLMEKKLNIKWFCQLRVDQLEQELLELMKQSGCDFISIGIESGSDIVLTSMQKKIKAADIANAAEMLRKANIGFQANFLFGDPSETNETITASLRFQQENELYFVDWSAVIPYAGTHIFDEAWEKGLIKDKVQFMRNQCDISGYLYKHQINMTKMSDAEYQDWYIRLREINDLNHRKRLGVVKRAVPVGKWQSDLTIECPSCQFLFDTDFCYPLATHGDGKINLDSPVGMLGVNLLCPKCFRKMHLMPRQIPHIEAFFKRFQEQVDGLKESGADVAVLPAMDRYYSVFKEDISLDGLNVGAVLDTRNFRIGKEFLGQEVKSFDQQSIQEHRNGIFLILPWVEYKKALDVLKNVGISTERILSWNQLFEGGEAGGDN